MNTKTVTATVFIYLFFKLKQMSEKMLSCVID